MKPTVNNLGISHEKGAVETARGSLKHRIDQAIKLRESADFASLQAYCAFLDKIVAKLNKCCKAALAEEQSQLKPLPRHRFMDFSELSVNLTTSSTISVKRGLYTVPSRLMGETLRIHLYHDRLTCFVGQTAVITLLPKTHWPQFIIGDCDCDWGSDGIMTEAEQREMDYLFKLRQSNYVKQLILENHCQSGWEQTVEGWEALSSELKISTWKRTRRVVIVRRRIKNNLVIAPDTDKAFPR